MIDQGISRVSIFDEDRCSEAQALQVVRLAERRVLGGVYLAPGWHGLRCFYVSLEAW